MIWQHRLPACKDLLRILMVKYHTLRRKRPSIQLSPSVAAILLFLFLSYVIGSYFIIAQKDAQLKDYQLKAVEIKKELDGAQERIDQQAQKFELERADLNRRIAELEERLKVLDVIKDFSEGAMNENDQAKLADAVFSESRRFGYDPLMIVAIIVTESDFRPDAKSEVGATGLMQLMPFVGKDLAEQVVDKSPNLWDNSRPMEWTGQKTLLDPIQNVRLGVLHLSTLILKFGNVRDGIRAYNSGPTRVKNRISAGQRLPKEYMQRVLKLYDELREKYGPRPDILQVEEKDFRGFDYFIADATPQVTPNTIRDLTSTVSPSLSTASPNLSIASSNLSSVSPDLDSPSLSGITVGITPETIVAMQANLTAGSTNEIILIPFDSE